MEKTAHQQPLAKTPQSNFIDEILAIDTNIESVIERLRSQTAISPVDARLNLQVLLNAIGREEESFKISTELMQIAPDDDRVLFNRGWHLIKRGKMQEGMRFLEYGRRLRTYGNLHEVNTSRPLWTKESGHGHRVILSLEGGYGDEIIHLRFGKDLVEKHGCRVTVACSPGLANVVSRMDWVSAVIQRQAIPGVYHDSLLPAMSAALALGYEADEISGEAYIQPNPKVVQNWRRLLRPRNNQIKIGLRWAGNPKFEHQQLRKFDPQLLINLQKIVPVDIDVQFYSFQRDSDLVDLPEEIVDLAPYLKDWEDTAAALENMDLVISSCTSIAHMSAAIGKPTWVVVPALPYFVWAFSGPKSPWYHSVRLFRQEVYGDWSSAERSLQSELTQWLRSHKRL
jgi:hypothetical protein